MTTTVDPPAGGSLPRAADKCRVAVFYVDTADRKRAIGLSDSLTERFWDEVDFEFSWWRFKYLEDPSISESAGWALRDADIVLVAAPAGSEPPSVVRDWFNLWGPLRTTANGVLLPLLSPANPEELSLSPWLSLLEEVSRQTGTECLLPSQLRDSPSFASPTRELQQRADHVTGVLDHILHNYGAPPQPPPRWGLNE